MFCQAFLSMLDVYVFCYTMVENSTWILWSKGLCFRPGFFIYLLFIYLFWSQRICIWEVYRQMGREERGKHLSCDVMETGTSSWKERHSELSFIFYTFLCKFQNYFDIKFIVRIFITQGLKNENMQIIYNISQYVCVMIFVILIFIYSQ